MRIREVEAFGARGIGAVGAIVPTVIVIGILTGRPGGIRIAVALVVAFTLGLVILSGSENGVVALAAWLVGLGTVRRIVTGFVGSSSSIDPLLTVGPIAIGILSIQGIRAGGLRNRTRLTNAALTLLIILALSAVNPLQGSPAIGITGLALVVGPMLAYIVGQELLSDGALTRLLQVVGALAVPAALYGLYQALVRFPAWDQRWITQQGYQALNVGGVIRPFASFASGQEFGVYAAIGLVIAFAIRRRGSWLWRVPVCCILSIAIWYESSRGLVVLLLPAIGVGLVARSRRSHFKGVLVLLVVMASVPWAVGRLAPKQFATDSTGRLQSHQVAGLSNPFGKGSTLPVHIALVAGGVASALHNPLGRGVGTVTQASGKFGGSGGATEADLGNVAVAGGILGFGAYLVIVVLGFSRAYRLAIHRGGWVPIAVLGILVVTFLQWLNGGLYAVTWLAWLVLGWVNRAWDTDARAMVTEARALMA